MTLLPPLHVQLGQLVKRAYAPLFETDPKAVEISDLGFALKEIVFGKDPGGDAVPYGFIATHVASGATVVALCGTRTGIEWVADLEALLVGCSWAPGAIHQGIGAIAVTLITSQAIPLEVYLKDESDLVFAGHSLGAALAEAWAVRLSAKLCVSLASPRWCDRQLAEYGMTRIGLLARYVVPWDLVPKIPLPFPLPFRHLGIPIELMAGPIRHTPQARHSIDTYLHGLDQSLPLPEEDLTMTGGKKP